MILQLLREKSTMKQQVYRNTKEVFDLLMISLKELSEELAEDMKRVDDRIGFNFKSKGEFEAEIKIAGDILIFHMHTNVFEFDKSHTIWNSSYVKEDAQRAFCGLINVYNFLSDSFKYNRTNDSGYLVARIFINKDNHFFVEGKRQLGFLYNDFASEAITPTMVKSIIESTILYSLDFDLLVPSYDSMKEVSVLDIEEMTYNMKFRTGKRLGFKFQADNDFV